MLPDRSRLKKINVSETEETGTGRGSRAKKTPAESRTSGSTRGEIEETGRNVAKNSTGDGRPRGLGSAGREGRRGASRRLISFIFRASRGKRALRTTKE